jgi:hypothetical protein
MSAQRPTLVLVHSGKISGELTNFFDKISAKVVDLAEFEMSMQVTHICASGDQDFRTINQMFSTVDNDIKIIALTHVKDLPSFLANNGRLVLDQNWLTEKLGQTILEKFFQGHASIQLAENFPSIREGISCKITNHMRIGSELDRLAHFVHSRDGAVVNVRTFVDHAIYYLVYLKQAGIAEAPFEIDCGHTGHQTILQIHLPVKSYLADYLLDSFGQPNGQDPLRYLLSICTHSADFTEIQYIQSAAKLVITGLWQNHKEVRKIGFSGLMINHIKTISQIENQISYQTQQIPRQTNASLESSAEAMKDKPLPGHLLEMVMPEKGHEGYFKDHPDLAKEMIAFVIDQSKERYPGLSVNELSEAQVVNLITEFYDLEKTSQLVESDFKHIVERVRKNTVSKAYEQQIARAREDLKHDDDFQKKLSESFVERVAEKISGSLDEINFAKIVKASVAPPDVAVVVGRGDDEQDAVIVVRGNGVRDELIHKIRGGVQEEVSKQVIKGTPMEVDDFIVRISQEIGNEVKGDWKVKTGLVQNVMPVKIRHSLERYATKMGQTLDSLTTSDLQLFSQTDLPSVIADFVTVDENFEIPESLMPDYKFRNTFQESLKTKMDSMFPGKTVDEVSGIITPEEQEKLLRTVVKESVRSAVKNDSILKEENLVKALSFTLHETEDEVKTIIASTNNEVKAMEEKQVIKRLFESPAPQINLEKTNLQNDAANSILVQKLRQTELDNKVVKRELEKALIELKVLKDSRVQVEKIEKKTQELVRSEIIHEPIPAKVSDKEVIPVEEKIRIIQDLATGKKVDPRETQRLKEALEREQKILMTAREAEQNVKIAKIEIQKKDLLFAQEIEKANRALKSRDLIVQKAKDGLTVMLERKDKEIKDLNSKLSNVISSSVSTQQANQEQKLRVLEQEKQSLNRLIEVYKNKLTSMAANLEKQNGGSNPKKDEDVRKVTLEKQRAEVALNLTQKEVTKLKSRTELDQAELTRLRSERKRLEEALKSALSTTGPVIATPLATNDAHEKALASLQNELKLQTQKTNKYELNIKELELKVTELSGLLTKSAASGGASDQAMKGKMAQMDASVRKLSADFAAATNQLGEAKKEINKARAENTALKNTLERLKKDLEKNKGKPAAPGKKAA